MERVTTSGMDLAWKKQQFVASRFGEFDTFGRSDIEVWLRDQREAKTPHFGNDLSHCLHNHDTSDFGWEFYLWRMFNGKDGGVSVLPNSTHLEALQAYGAVVGEGMQKHTENYPLLYKEKDLLSLFLGFAKGRAYCLYNGFVFDFGGTLGVFTFTRKHGDNAGSIKYSREIWPMSWMESVLMNWSDCSDEAARIKARNFLCDCLERRIQLERDKAEVDFDAAVAVSEDGAKIVSADRVLISRYDRTLQMYDKSSFADIKLLKVRIFIRNCPVELVTVTRENVIAMFEGQLNLNTRGHCQRYFDEVKMPNGLVEKWLWCHIGEDAFPKGGATFLSM